MRIMAVDHGESRTGIAVCDPSEFLASPDTVIEEKNTTRSIEKIAQRAAELGAEMIVIGLPLNMDGTEGERAQKCRYVASQLSEKTGLEVVLRDERATTVEAGEILSANGRYRKKRKKVIDAVAAVLILEDFLSERKREREKEGS